MSNKLISAGLTQMFWKVAEQRGISRAELFRASGLEAHELHDPDALIPETALFAVLRMLLQRTGDPALGLELARAFELKAMGFWGFALTSALTLRQRLQLHMHYSRLLNSKPQISMRTEAERFLVDFTADHVPQDLVPVMVDLTMGITCLHHARHVGAAVPDVELWFTYPERPHHREIRALVTGPVRFDAPHFRVSIPAKDLDRRLPGDVHLFELTKRQLDAQLAKVSAALPADLLVQVRERLATRLAGDASLQRIAGDLQLSPRTLRRHLHEMGASFQALLEEARRSRATAYLTGTNQAIKQVAAQLGYRDPSNFRRAFRRWTGLAPEAYRTAQRNQSS